MSTRSKKKKITKCFTMSPRSKKQKEQSVLLCQPDRRKKRTKCFTMSTRSKKKKEQSVLLCQPDRRKKEEIVSLGQLDRRRTNCFVRPTIS